MNRKQLTTIVVLGLVIIGLGVALKSKSTRAWKSSGPGLGQKVLPDFPLNDIAQIVIRQATNELTLAKKNADDLWRVQQRAGYPANFSEIGEFLRKVWELKSLRAEKIGPSQLGRLELAAPGQGDKSGTLVEFKDKDGKTLASLLLGKKHMRAGGDASPMGGGEGWPDGRFLMVPGAATTVRLVSETFNNVEPKPEAWVNKDFFKIEKIRSVAVTTTNSWKLSRETETGEMKLADAKEGEALDSAKASGIANAFSYPSFDDVLPPDTAPDTVGLDQPWTARVETFEGFAYELKIGHKPGEETHYLTLAVTADLSQERTPGKDEKPEDKDKLDKEFKAKNEKLKEKLDKEKALDRWVFKVSKYTVDSILKDRPQLMVEKKEDPKPGDKPGAADADADEKDATDEGTADVDFTKDPTK